MSDRAHAIPTGTSRAPRPWWWWLAFTVGVAWAFACGALTYLTAAGYPIQ
jgi:hypothetical protein